MLTLSSSKASSSMRMPVTLQQVPRQQVDTVQSSRTPALLLQKQVISPWCLLVLLLLLLLLLLGNRRLQPRQQMRQQRQQMRQAGVQGGQAGSLSVVAASSSLPQRRAQAR
jgi:hypothetical protein